MTLSEFIAQIGDAPAADLFGVTVRTAMSWRLGERVPRPGKAKEIVDLAGGDVTFHGCYTRMPTRRDGGPTAPAETAAPERKTE